MHTILILDDERFVTLLVKNALRLQDFEVIGVTDPRQALATLEQTPVSLLVTDLMMPLLDGFEVIRRVRSQPALKKLPIIVLTAKKVTTEERRELVELEVEILSKPFLPTALAEKIRQKVA